MKHCRKCGRNKEETEFYKRGRDNNYLSSPCKECTNKAGRDRRDVKGYKSHEDKYRIEHPDRVKRSRLKNRYGITPEELDEMYDSQGGRCAICGKQLAKYHIDHDHETGRIRGLLCAGCNRGLGFFGDSLAGILRAVDYLSRQSES